MDTTLKQRLIGAAVLVALAVIFLPMLVQGPAPDSGVADVSMRVPDAPAGEYETRELPLLGPAPATGAPAAQPLPAPASQDAASTAAAPAADPAARDATPAAPVDAAAAAGNWAVSFGAYASARDADAVIARLRQAGLKGFSEQTTINGRQAWRVRVGPYPDRALAEAGRLQAIRIRGDVNAQVVALDAGTGPDASPAPATAAAAATSAAAAPSAATTRPASQPAAAAATPAVRSEALPAERPATPPARTATTASTAPATGATPVPARTTRTPTPAPATAPARPAAPPPAPATPAASGVGFAVQMGAFGRVSDANALRDRLRGAGYSAIVQPVNTDKGTLHRVRVGPVSSRAEADQLKSRLAGGFGAGMVVSHP